MNDELTELVDEQAYSWLEMHKKSALSYLVLKALSSNDMWSQELIKWISGKTSWSVTEKGLYRLLRRMEKSGLISHTKISVKRTGAERNIFSINTEGTMLLGKIEKLLRYLPV